MDSHELAKRLLDNPPVVVSASVDISTSEEDHGLRVFGYDLCSPIFTETECTLLFTDFDRND